MALQNMQKVALTLSAALAWVADWGLKPAGKCPMQNCYPERLLCVD